MSQLSQSAAGSTCPNPECEEPVESGDRFCGRCGHDLSALPAPAADRGDQPTVALNGTAAAGSRGGHGRPDGTPAAAVEWPAAAPGSGSGTPVPVPETAPSGTADEQGAAAAPQAPGAPAAPAAPPSPPVPPSPPLPSAPPSPQSPPVPPVPPVPPGAGPPAPPAADAGTDAGHPLAGSGLPDGFTMREEAGDAPNGGPAPAPQPQPAAEPRAGAPAGAADEAATGTPAATADAPAEAPAGAQGHEAAGHGAEHEAGPGPQDATSSGTGSPAGTPHATAAPPAADTAAAGTDPRTVAPEALPTPPAGMRLCVFCGTGRVGADHYCEHCGKAQPRERDHMEQKLGAVAAVSDRGLRHHRNEDAFAVSATALKDGTPAVVAVVCDGVSSATRPDDASLAASRAAIESLLDALPRGTHPQLAMHEAILAAADAVNALAEEPETMAQAGPNQNAPACTLVGAIVAKDLLTVGWIGDSRAYWVPVDRTASPARLTEDDSWAAQMVASGLMNEAEAYADDRAHAITGWLGADAYELTPHTASYQPDQPGVVLVCTDGLWNYAEGAGDMMSVLPADAAEQPLNSARTLVGHALDGGGHDNITVAVLPFPVPPRTAGAV